MMAAVTERRASVFFTGNAGTGKSYLLCAVVAELKRLHGERGVFVTASTGIAASPPSTRPPPAKPESKRIWLARWAS